MIYKPECIWMLNYVITHTHDIITIIPQNTAQLLRRLLNLYIWYYKFKSNILVPIFIIDFCFVTFMNKYNILTLVIHSFRDVTLLVKAEMANSGT